MRHIQALQVTTACIHALKHREARHIYCLQDRAATEIEFSQLRICVHSKRSQSGVATAVKSSQLGVPDYIKRSQHLAVRDGKRCKRSICHRESQGCRLVISCHINGITADGICIDIHQIQSLQCRASGEIKRFNRVVIAAQDPEFVQAGKVDADNAVTRAVHCFDIRACLQSRQVLHTETGTFHIYNSVSFGDADFAIPVNIEIRHHPPFQCLVRNDYPAVIIENLRTVIFGQSHRTFLSFCHPKFCQAFIFRAVKGGKSAVFADIQRNKGIFRAVELCKFCACRQVKSGNDIAWAVQCCKFRTCRHIHSRQPVRRAVKVRQCRTFAQIYAAYAVARNIQSLKCSAGNYIQSRDGIVLAVQFCEFMVFTEIQDSQSVVCTVKTLQGCVLGDIQSEEFIAGAVQSLKSRQSADIKAVEVVFRAVQCRDWRAACEVKRSQTVVRHIDGGQGGVVTQVDFLYLVHAAVKGFEIFEILNACQWFHRVNQRSRDIDRHYSLRFFVWDFPVSVRIVLLYQIWLEAGIWNIDIVRCPRHHIDEFRRKFTVPVRNDECCIGGLFVKEETVFQAFARNHERKHAIIRYGYLRNRQTDKWHRLCQGVDGTHGESLLPYRFQFCCSSGRDNGEIKFRSTGSDGAAIVRIGHCRTTVSILRDVGNGLYASHDFCYLLLYLSDFSLDTVYRLLEFQNILFSFIHPASQGRNDIVDSLYLAVYTGIDFIYFCLDDTSKFSVKLGYRLLYRGVICSCNFGFRCFKVGTQLFYCSGICGNAFGIFMYRIGIVGDKFGIVCYGWCVFTYLYRVFCYCLLVGCYLVLRFGQSGTQCFDGLKILRDKPGIFSYQGRVLRNQTLVLLYEDIVCLYGICIILDILQILCDFSCIVGDFARIGCDSLGVFIDFPGIFCNGSGICRHRNGNFWYRAAQWAEVFLQSLDFSTVILNFLCQCCFEVRNHVFEIGARSVQFVFKFGFEGCKPRFCLCNSAVTVKLLTHPWFHGCFEGFESFFLRLYKFLFCSGNSLRICICNIRHRSLEIFAADRIVR